MHKPLSTTKAPRAAASYRGARRNAARAAGGLSEWRTSCIAAVHANEKAFLDARRVQANDAREAFSKGVIEAQANPRGLPGSVVGMSAMLDFYRGEKRTRPVNRIIRALEGQLRA